MESYTAPARGYFLTKIFHPNIATDGEICVNALKRDWNPSLGLRHVLIVVRCLLIEPFPESALNAQAGKMLLDNYEEYARHARYELCFSGEKMVQMVRRVQLMVTMATGMVPMLHQLKMQVLGTHNVGIDDTRNITRVLQRLIIDGAVV
ncbi:hypothetical protein POM88_041830 [Heracleum sosnowskyi]|uniref:UBC core domain-containing protein n=1 Tax=Heracleum sosnowskyi TaxID=360622 RepID=A0AAD8HH45_9APIA|nr:hypothetical protein POM88_041830 [Heracleum sosnowskyi]